MKLPSFLRGGDAEKTVAERPASDLHTEVRGDIAHALTSPEAGRLEHVWNVLSNNSARLAALAAAGTLEGCESVTGNGYVDAAILATIFGTGLVGMTAASIGFKFLKPSEWVILRNRWIGGSSAGYEKRGGVALWFRPTHTPWATNPAQPKDVTIDGTEQTFPTGTEWSDKIEIAGVPLQVSWSVILRLKSPKQVMFALGPDWQRTQERIKDTTNSVLIETFGRAPLPAALIQSPIPTNATPDVIARHVMNSLNIYNNEINGHARIRQAEANWGIELEVQLGPVSEDSAIQQRRMALQQAGIDVQIAQTNVAKAKAEGEAALAKATGDAEAVKTILAAQVEGLKGADPTVAAVLVASQGSGTPGVAQAAITAGAIRSVAQAGINVNIQPAAPSSGNTGSGPSGSTP